MIHHPIELSSIIFQKIKQHGPISFCDFMEMSLYYPELGYYTSTHEKIGKDGDFYTSSNLTSAFGEMLGRQIEELWRFLGEKEFIVVEMGAGLGLLSGDVLSYLKQNQELYRDLNYCIVEKSPTFRNEQKERLGAEKVSWYDSITELSGMTGCIFSNELPDAFPVHVVEMEKELMEVFVDYENGFMEVFRPATDELKNYLEELTIKLPFGYRTEINLDAVKWIQEIGSTLKKGCLLYTSPSPRD